MSIMVLLSVESKSWMSLVPVVMYVKTIHVLIIPQVVQKSNKQNFFGLCPYLAGSNVLPNFYQ